MGVGVGPMRLWAPCRVVWVIDEPRRYGYGYGTGYPSYGYGYGGGYANNYGYQAPY